VVELWSLCISSSTGGSYKVYGTEQVMREAFHRWVEISSSLRSSEHEVMCISGMTNTADRSESEFAIKVDKVVSMQLFKEY